MMRKWFILFVAALGLLSLGAITRSAVVRFPVEVSINASAHYLIDTEICIINLKNAPVTITFGYYNSDGAKGSCPIPATITINPNDTWTHRVGGCFAVAIPMNAFHLVGIGEISAPTKSVGVYWRIYDVSGNQDLLLDHGKESP